MKRKHASFFLFFLCAFHSVQPLTHDTQDLVVLFLFLFVSFRFTLPSLLSSIVSERKTKEREGHNTSKQPGEDTVIGGLFLSFLLIRFISCFHSFRFSITNEPNKRKRENKPNKPDNRGDTWAVRLSEWLVSCVLCSIVMEEWSTNWTKNTTNHTSHTAADNRGMKGRMKDKEKNHALPCVFPLCFILSSFLTVTPGSLVNLIRGQSISASQGYSIGCVVWFSSFYSCFHYNDKEVKREWKHEWKKQNHTTH